MSFRSTLVRGELVHARRDAFARRAFRYPVYVASIDLAELPALDRGLRLFSHNARNLFALDDRAYHLGAPGAALAPALAALLAGNGLPAPHTTRLVTNLRVAGYVFNPVSFFLNYGAAGELASVIAEVNNTYGGSARYVLGPGERVADDGRTIRFRHPRQLFVSPFLHGPATYEFSFDAPLGAAHLEIAMRVIDHTAPPSGAAADPGRAPTGEHSAPPSGAAADPGRAPTGEHSAPPSGAAADPGRAPTGEHTAPPSGAAADPGRAPTGEHTAPPSGAAADPGRAPTGEHTGTQVFHARLAGDAQPLTDRALAAAAVRYPLMTAQVIGLIHWQALKLRLLGAPYRRPDRDHRPHPAVSA